MGYWHNSVVECWACMHVNLNSVLVMAGFCWKYALLKMELSLAMVWSFETDSLVVFCAKP